MDLQVMARNYVFIVNFTVVSNWYHSGVVLVEIWFQIMFSFSRNLFEEIPVVRAVALRACQREHQAVVLHAIPPISMKLCQFNGSTQKLKKTNWFLFRLFPGGDRPPPVFLGFHQGNRFKIGQMYEALTAMVFNQLL